MEEDGGFNDDNFAKLKRRKLEDLLWVWIWEDSMIRQREDACFKLSDVFPIPDENIQVEKSSHLRNNGNGINFAKQYRTCQVAATTRDLELISWKLKSEAQWFEKELKWDVRDNLIDRILIYRWVKKLDFKFQIDFLECSSVFLVMDAILSFDWVFILTLILPI